MTNHICFICDEKYVLPTSVAISSLKRSLRIAEGDTYVCHVLSFGLSEAAASALCGLSAPDFQVRVQTVDPQKYEERLNQVRQKTHVTKSSLLKFELPNLLPECEKVLYLDSDVLVKGDISPVFSLDLSDYYMAAVPDYWESYDCIRYQFGNVSGDERFTRSGFNAGFMLYNITKMREDRLPEALWEKKLSDTTMLMDQSCLNEVIGQKYLHLPVRYNFNPMFLGEFNVPYFNRFFRTDYQSISDVVSDAAVVHYMCHGAKPWIYKNTALGNFWLDEYRKMGNDPDTLGLKKQKRKILPEFCKGRKDVCKGKYGYLGYLSYFLLIVKNWKYYRKLLKSLK